MPRSAPSKKRSKDKHGRQVPWSVLAQIAFLLASRWWSLSEKERARIVALVRDSRGRPGNLSSRERWELRKLAGRLDLKGLSREFAMLTSTRRGRRRGRGRCPAP